MLKLPLNYAMNNYIIAQSLVGELLIISKQLCCGANVITALYPKTHSYFDEAMVEMKLGVEISFEQSNNHVLLEAVAQLEQYFLGKIKHINLPFNLPLAPHGTDFQQLVWQYLRHIPYGETLSYGDVATGINQPKSVRAVASAIAKNPISIIIPCHRVIRKSGAISGYAGGVAMKEWLLDFEGVGKYFSKRIKLN